MGREEETREGKREKKAKESEKEKTKCVSESGKSGERRKRKGKGNVAQLVVHLRCMQGVTSSNLVISKEKEGRKRCERKGEQIENDEEEWKKAGKNEEKGKVEQ